MQRQHEQPLMSENMVFMVLKSNINVILMQVT